MRKENIKSNLSKHSFLFEISWEVCNQVGGIYRVINSKLHLAASKWEENYCLLGPYLEEKAPSEFEILKNSTDAVAEIVTSLQKNGYEIYYGYWLTTNKPKVVLLNPRSIMQKLDLIKYEIWERQHISINKNESLLDEVLAFGFLVKVFFQTLYKHESFKKRSIIAHFHEWMSATSLPEMRRLKLPITTIFTTHATVLGRYLAMNDDVFYKHLSSYDWEKEAIKFDIEAKVKLERAAAHGAHIFTTVSEVTKQECIHLLGRKPDVILPNGLKISRFTALHEFQNLHQDYKFKIHDFVIGHFFKYDAFDVDKTLYFFTSGRYEYKNKGFDLTIEALARLNWKMKKEGSDKIVIMFIVTSVDHHSINSNVLQNRDLIYEIKRICKAMVSQIGERLFYTVTASQEQKLPDFRDFVDDYWIIRLRKTIHAWKSHDRPSVITHDLKYGNELLDMIHKCQLFNDKNDKVKIVYHPDFIVTTNPLFSLDYSQFVRGCHLGIFAGYYEPWGYTPLECIASGVPAITSDLAGFGNYVLKTVKDSQSKGIYVIRRNNKSYEDAARELTNCLFNFTSMERRERIHQRNQTEAISVKFAWKELYKYYMTAYHLGVKMANS